MVINQTTRPNTMESLIRDLKAMGIKEGETLLVHSSLSSIGWTCGAQVTVIKALLNVLGKTGTLVMPAHTADNSDPAEWQNPPVPREWLVPLYQSLPAFEKELTPTRGMGRIAESFRTFPKTLRSDHPQTSFCANGKMAKFITEDHVLTPQFGLDTPIGKLYKMNARVLLLGVGYGNCTSFHLAEVLTKQVPKVKMGTAMTINGCREWVWFEDLDFDCDDFELIGNEYEENGLVTIGKIGEASCRLFEIRPAVDFATQWMLEHRSIGGLS